MLSENNSHLPVSFPFILNDISTIAIPLPAVSFLSSTNMGGSNNGGATQRSDSAITTVAQALEAARDTAEGAQDPTVVYILETALVEIWGKIQAQPSSYVMTRDEFAVFNYFASRFVGQQLATAAIKRYWDNLELENGR